MKFRIANKIMRKINYPRKELGRYRALTAHRAWRRWALALHRLYQHMAKKELDSICRDAIRRLRPVLDLSEVTDETFLTIAERLCEYRTFSRYQEANPTIEALLANIGADASLAMTTGRLSFVSN